MDRQMGRWTDGWAGGQTDGWTDRWVDRQVARLKQTEGWGDNRSHDIVYMSV